MYFDQFRASGAPQESGESNSASIRLIVSSRDANLAIFDPFHPNNDNNYYDGSMSQLYMIDGQALDVSYFGFTDPLTNTWRPKKLNIKDTPTGSWGTNGFYLPFDGSAPIGQDQSGNGNDWTPKNFGTLLEITKATGALPILDTANGGRTGLPTVRGSVGVAVTVAAKTGGGNAFYFDGVEAATVNFARGQTVTFDTSDSTVATHPLRFSITSDKSVPLRGS